MVAGRCKFEAQICDRLYKLRRYVNFRITPKEVAEDVYGDVIVKMWKAIRDEKFKATICVDAFMWRCAWCVLCDYYRREGREKRTDNGEYGYYLSTLTRDPEKEYEARTINNAFIESVAQLKAICRKVLILSLYQNMKHWEIANTLGISRSAVSTHLFRIRKELGGLHLNKVRTRTERENGR